VSEAGVGVTIVEGGATPSEPRCALHPDAIAAAGTCGRCGSYMCAACAADGFGQPMCRACARRLLGGRFVSQVPALGIVMMIHGAMILSLGILLVVYGLFFAAATYDTPNELAAPTELIAQLVVSSMVGIGLLHFLPGVLQIVAGWRTRTYRSRGFAIAALGAGLLAMVGCYCAPTSIAMLIWGLVVLLGKDVVARFASEEASAMEAP
jgi:hypothetical protein